MRFTRRSAIHGRLISRDCVDRAEACGVDDRGGSDGHLSSRLDPRPARVGLGERSRLRRRSNLSDVAHLGDDARRLVVARAARCRIHDRHFSLSRRARIFGRIVEWSLGCGAGRDRRPPARRERAWRVAYGDLYRRRDRSTGIRGCCRPHKFLRRMARAWRHRANRIHSRLHGAEADARSPRSYSKISNGKKAETV